MVSVSKKVPPESNNPIEHLIGEHTVPSFYLLGAFSANKTAPPKPTLTKTTQHQQQGAATPILA
jgi:hypothetical protein